MTLEELNHVTPEQAVELFQSCCAAPGWIQGMVDGRPYANRGEMIRHSRSLWPTLSEADWLQAFEAHPKIGDLDSLRARYANTKALASGEQAGTQSASEHVLNRLKTGNDHYLDKFGFIFIVCATGKSAADMLELLEARLPNSRHEELQNAAAEQANITELRLEKLV
ncbi:2-oxo-4-hydroxy-4-carboxy-5-ureidoimidazoline decarboxylase [Marinobacter salinisoli]|uniref:2-oxo-4-hydroxy-4-carboxy-5-ureidoimidazoline decarboxylase n=1 Tax=Marinobacter salinisoli TaxID=2769486 RepID=A0ABX7MSV1_9GAMM|nr:2-oxo-4-hydroxy-4-carboxy-5-ureidoimidazoline decarboxylase [Marinobacter salinisoli]QSP95364.1 2-oxo-4-hydroxy-4-carboxy-5-ureidoimidazoline decarboxylase [Marinobacter salinisoli]